MEPINFFANPVMDNDEATMLEVMENQWVSMRARMPYAVHDIHGINGNKRPR